MRGRQRQELHDDISAFAIGRGEIQATESALSDHIALCHVMVQPEGPPFSRPLAPEKEEERRKRCMDGVRREVASSSPAGLPYPTQIPVLENRTYTTHQTTAKIYQIVLEDSRILIQCSLWRLAYLWVLKMLSSSKEASSRHREGKQKVLMGCIPHLRAIPTDQLRNLLSLLPSHSSMPHHIPINTSKCSHIPFQISFTYNFIGAGVSSI